MPSSSKCILIVEDDSYIRSAIVGHLQDRHVPCIEAGSYDEAVRLLKSNAEHIAVAVLDVRIPKRAGSSVNDASRTAASGVTLGRHLRTNYPHVRVIGMSFFANDDSERWFLEHGNDFLSKNWLIRGAHDEFIQKIQSQYSRKRRKRSPASFVVHGHDRRSLVGLLRFVESDLGWTRPKVLSEMPSHGRTIIEKFEDVAHTVDVVFVLLTPDDEVLASRRSRHSSFRARQNVIFELGYFFAKLQRTGGRVVALYKQPVELPSDIHGIVYIDVSAGIAASADAIRTELKHWM